MSTLFARLADSASASAVLLTCSAALTIGVLYCVGKHSELVNVAMYELLELLIQVYQMLQWEGSDPLQRVLLADLEFQRVQARQVAPGDAAAVVGLAWLLALNVAASTALVLMYRFQISL